MLRAGRLRDPSPGKGTRSARTVVAVVAFGLSSACASSSDGLGASSGSGGASGDGRSRGGTGGDRPSTAGSGGGAGSTLDASSKSDVGSNGGAGSNGDASAVDRDSSAAGNDGGARGDAAVRGSGGDSGQPPYKGVANSTCAEMGILGSTWYYDWKLSPEERNCTAGKFVPMIWGHTGAEQSASGIAGEIGGIVSAGYDTVFGFNEPDNSTQSNITVEMAISLWPSFNDPALRVGSPATQANTTGMAWFKSFMSQVNADITGRLRVDFIAAHWYGWNAGSCEPNASTLESYLKQIEAIPGNRPIWLTEWGCMNASNPDAATVQTFFSGAIAMFAKHPRIERYAWYPWNTHNELFSNRNSMPPTLSPLGTIFSKAPASK